MDGEKFSAKIEFLFSKFVSFLKMAIMGKHFTKVNLSDISRLVTTYCKKDNLQLFTVYL